MADFAELHCHSHFSFLDGASSVDDLCGRAQTLGLGALAVTDHQGLYGAVRFATAAGEVGLRPIIGLEVELLDAAVADPLQIVVPARRRVRRAGAVDPDQAAPHDGEAVRPRAARTRLPGHREPVREDLRGIAAAERGPHLVLLARDQAGYRSLCRLVSGAHLGGTKGAPRFTQELLARHAEGLVALSGCRHGEIARRLLADDSDGAAQVARRYAELFAPLTGLGSGFFLELQHHLLPADDRLLAGTVELARRLGLPVVVTNDAHYARPDDREMQDVLVGIRHGLTLDESAHLRRPNGEYHLKSAAELSFLPPGEPDADPSVGRAWAEGIRTAGEVGERCGIDLDFDRYRFPGFAVPKGETPFSQLERLCHDGARQRYHPMTPAVLKQMAHELEVIERTGLAEFFLICWDLMRFARERGIPAQGRGSAGDSIVAYVLGITRVDPIRHNLLFERFINEGRTAYPDVDIDFASSRREEVIQYVYERYGEAHTGMVCNVVTYRARSAVREVGYALGFPRALVDRVAKALETYDSVMVRRDLEAEGGFAEFFQAPTPQSVPALAPPQAIPAARTTQAARTAARLARSEGFVDEMGQLNHVRGSRVLLDDEGGPGDSAVSVAWLGAELSSSQEQTPPSVEHTLSPAICPPVLQSGLEEPQGEAHAPVTAPRSVERAHAERGAASRRGLTSLSGRASKAYAPPSADSKNGLHTDPLKDRDLPHGGSTTHLSPWERWLELCARIDGFPRHLGIHTGGMLVTRAPLVDIAPLERATMPGRVVVQYDKRDIETIKLIKLDLLGLRMLSAIDDALRDIAVDCGVQVDLDRLPEDLPEVFAMIQAADTVGVFQIESRA
ncbi:MAG: PHP domain-containing protein, partial [Candidatus Limnocylindrales bacterium]